MSEWQVLSSVTMVEVTHPSTVADLELSGIVTDCRQALAAADVAENISVEQTNAGVTIAFDVRVDTDAATPSVEDNEERARRIASRWGFE